MPALEAITASRDLIERLADDPQPHYGVSTGFGALATTSIPPERRQQLQRSLVRSHAASSGPEVEREVVRGTMLLRLSTLATGRTGVRSEVAQQYVGLLNAGITDALAAIDPSDIHQFLPAANAVQKLIAEAEMGELFKVIAFSRGIDGTLDAFARGDRSHAL